MNKTDKITSTTEVKRGKAGDKIITCAKCGKDKQHGGNATIKIKQVHPETIGKYQKFILPVCQDCVIEYMTNERAIEQARERGY